MPVAQAGDDEPAVCFDNFGVGAHAIAGTRHNTCDAPVADGDVMIRQDFTAVYIEPLATANDGFGRGASGGDGNKVGGHIGPGGKRVVLHAPIVVKFGSGSRGQWQSS